VLVVLQAARVLLCTALRPSQRQGRQQRPALPSQYSVWSVKEKTVREDVNMKTALAKCDRSVNVKWYFDVKVEADAEEQGAGKLDRNSTLA
jgi:hypothetical protein